METMLRSHRPICFFSSTHTQKFILQTLTSCIVSFKTPIKVIVALQNTVAPYFSLPILGGFHGTKVLMIKQQRDDEGEEEKILILLSLSKLIQREQHLQAAHTSYTWCIINTDSLTGHMYSKTR